MSNALAFKTNQAIIIGMGLIVSITINGVHTAAALDQIHASREVSAPVDKVWNTFTNQSNDNTWNQVDVMKITKKTSNMIEADIRVGPPTMGHEIITLHPKQSVITNITNGPVTGNRVVTLSPLSENKTKVDVLWNVDLSGIPFFAKGSVKDGLKRTEQALVALWATLPPTGTLPVNVTALTSSESISMPAILESPTII